VHQQGSSDVDAVRSVVRRINELWLGRQYDAIGELLAEQVVIAPPGSAERIRGREAYVRSYREYDQAATTLEFVPGDPRIDIVGDVAVAVCPFRIVYEMNGKTYRERGHEVLVLSRSGGGWRIAWRTMQAEPDDHDDG